MFGWIDGWVNEWLAGCLTLTVYCSLHVLGKVAPAVNLSDKWLHACVFSSWTWCHGWNVLLLWDNGNSNSNNNHNCWSSNYNNNNSNKGISKQNQQLQKQPTTFASIEKQTRTHIKKQNKEEQKKETETTATTKLFEMTSRQVVVKLPSSADIKLSTMTRLRRRP